MTTLRNYDINDGTTNNKEYQDFNFYFGQVLTDPLKDENGAGKCKIFIRILDRELFGKGSTNSDGTLKPDVLKRPENYSDLIDTLPDSYVMETKFFYSLPKVGETVIVFLNLKNNPRFNRYYIGPVLPQPQDYDGDGNVFGILKGLFGSGAGLYSYQQPWFENKQSRLGGKESSSNWNCFPSHPKDPTDVAIHGRGNEDIILRSSSYYDEILLRTAKYKRTNKSELNLVNPGYISIVSYESSRIPSLNEDLSTVNVVADQINLISYKGSPLNNTTKLGGLPGKSDGLILNSSEPEKQLNLQNIHLRPTVYGDVLWDVLKKLRSWVENHKHSGGGVAYTVPSKDGGTRELLASLDDALGSNPLTKISPNGKEYLEYQGNLISNNIKIN